jgi:thymidylate synthase
MRTQADKIYLELLQEVLTNGDQVTTRNSDVYSHFNLPNVTFTEFPLITLRKTAAMKAIREMEFFLSGNPKCPEELLDWWSGQLNPQGMLWNAYPEQFRHSSFEGSDGGIAYFDQVAFIKDALKTNPNSRRLLISLWNGGEMAAITETNENPNCPTVCHSIVIQFFVREGSLHMKTYQRSVH